ncbi:RNA polymerase sigma factor [Streptomyces sp. NBC_00154]|uniref:RNA polymerase sigma factor n=1 Tax=Streptomyces sp. NBC_00154 TaxID=2975670 RepID=UPI00225BDF69|nr:sigma-70 family RNA polymerase sigma factor [Streptomyces sp. NBC_00154]MCX5316165.1 sigma-70 family RNA polymerase sigma factor [Streptomyces sp. NBC_00154]MCX5318062.1 sigma-70 family RNA polymerase sigma factor [Streptomyces sp. NBC_00154]MCX5318161.1 sigma-70 family RNA polymerase sigma factor [Streptomyces sp. NBC_00154]
MVAEVFLVAWRRFGELPEGKALAWLYGVARRTLANAYRSDKHRLRVSEWLKAQPHDEGGDHTEDVALRMEMATAFDALSEADQEVLRLALWDEVASSQGAKILGCGVGAYQVRLHRARKRLKNGLALRLLDGTAPQWDALVQSATTKRGEAGA